MSNPGSTAARGAQQAILAADDARYAAMIAADARALRKLLAPELVYCHSSGSVDTRDSYLASLEGGAVKYLEVRRFAEAFQVLPEVGVMTGFHRVVVRFEGGERVLQNRFTTTWLPRNGGWVLLVWASTPVATLPPDAEAQAPR
jgi:hypothetical protein